MRHVQRLDDSTNLLNLFVIFQGQPGTFVLDCPLSRSMTRVDHPLCQVRDPVKRRRTGDPTRRSGYSPFG